MGNVENCVVVFSESSTGNLDLCSFSCMVSFGIAYFQSNNNMVLNGNRSVFRLQEFGFV